MDQLKITYFDKQVETISCEDCDISDSGMLHIEVGDNSDIYIWMPLNVRKVERNVVNYTINNVNTDDGDDD